MRGLAIFLCACLMGQGAWAEAPATSPRPNPRPAAEISAQAGAETAKAVASAPMLRPKRRPEPAPTNVAPVTAPMQAPTLRPKRRPETLLASAAPDQMAPDEKPQAHEEAPKKGKKASKKGSVCGDPAIKGEALAAIKGKVKGCGLDAPVRVTSVSGIRLNQPATISCDTAAALKSWIDKGLRPAMGNREVIEIRIAASYICRPRNNKKGAKISEHGRGKALDIAGFVFSDGSQWSVVSNYNKQVRRAHKAACGIFGTTLGPGSDGYHEDHLHFDIASYRGGPYCK